VQSLIPVIGALEEIMTKKEIAIKVSKIHKEVTKVNASIEQVKLQLNKNNNIEYSKAAYEQLAAYSNQLEQLVNELNILLSKLQNND